MAENDQPQGKPAHGLTDHAMGEQLTHKHAVGRYYDHDHDDFEEDVPLEENPIWIQDHVSLVSVGIDIGSSGTPGLFSPIHPPPPGRCPPRPPFPFSREALSPFPRASAAAP